MINREMAPCPICKKPSILSAIGGPCMGCTINQAEFEAHFDMNLMHQPITEEAFTKS